MLKLKNTVGIILLAALSSACTTLGNNAETLSGDKKSVVVTQTGRREPIVSGHERRYFLDLRQKKALLPRMSGALATGEAQAALELARGQLAKKPGDVEAMILMANALIMTKNYDLAAYYAGLVDKASPGHAAALNVKGVATMLTPKARMADFRKAVAYFEAAFAADEKQIAPGMNLASLQLELGNAGAAAKTFGQVANRCGDCTAALMGFGIASSRSGGFVAAKGAFEKVLARNAHHSAALYQIALVHKNGLGDSKRAEAYLNQLLADSSIKDTATRERAHSVLRSSKGTMAPSDRLEVADENDAKDAELMLTTMDADSVEE